MERTATHPELFELGDPDAREVVRWRFDSLVQAGYPWSAAVILARHAEVDLHLATDLVARGCPAGTALRILL
jgi:hypothetical protein